MTKAEELNLLRKLIDKLSDTSYLGPWLKHHEDDIRWAIKNDLPIESVLGRVRNLPVIVR
jgi:hypothetical protein